MNNILKKIFRKKVDFPTEPNGKYTPLNTEKFKQYNAFRPDGPQKLFCYVPFTNMTFSFRGRVLACAYNQKVELGKYPDQSINDMWFNSEMGNELRNHMEHNDLSYGCKHCKYFFENQKFSGLKPLVFDKYSDSTRTSYPKVLEFELSNVCNFECVMCNGEVSSSIRKNQDKLPPIKIPYDDAFVEQLREFIPHLEEAKFYGGEPFLIPIYFKIWELIIELNPKVKIFVITNGSVLNDKVKNIVKKGNFDIGVSMDSVRKEVLESIRLNVNYEELLENIDYFNKELSGWNERLKVSFTMMRTNWQEFTDVIEFCNKKNIVLYVSYLKTPPKYALWNLPSEELKRIRESLEGKSFSKRGYVKNNNAQCYEDFLTYLKNCEQENLKRPESEILPYNKSEVKEEHQLENMSSETNEKEIDAQFSEHSISSEYKKETVYKIFVEEKIKSCLDKTTGPQSESEFNQFFIKLERAMAALPSKTDVNKIYFTIHKSEAAKVIKDVQEHEVDKLTELMKQHL